MHVDIMVKLWPLRLKTIYEEQVHDCNMALNGFTNRSMVLQFFCNKNKSTFGSSNIYKY